MLMRIMFLMFLALAQSCMTLPPVLNTTELTTVDFSKVRNFKRGESCTTIVLNLLPFGSTRITSAVRDGNISSLKILEYETRNYLVISQFCLIAYGT